MREVLLLLKKDLIRFFWFFQNFGEATRSKKMSRKLLMMVVFIVSISFSLFSVFKMMGGMYQVSAKMGAETSFFQSLVLAFTMLIIITIVPYAMSKLYYGKGILGLLSLPLRASSIIISSIYYISFSFLLYAILIALPAMIEHQNLHSVGFLYYALGLLSLFAYSVILSSIVTFAVIILMKLISRYPKSKNILQMLGMFALLAIIVVIQINAPKLGSSNYSNSFESFSSFSGVSANFNVFTPFKLAAESLAKTSVTDMLIPIMLNLIIGLGLSLLIGTLSSRLWLSGVNNMSQVSKVKVRKGYYNSAKLYKEGSVVLGVAKKDIRNILSTPVYIFNILLSGILVPFIMLIVAYLQTSKSFDILGLINQGIYDTYIAKLPIDQLNFHALALVAGMAIGAMTALYGSSASSTITREGKSIWLTQVLPISIRVQINGRILAAAMLMMVTNSVFILLTEFILRAPLSLFLAAILGSLLSSLAIIAYSLFMDILNPKLTWDTPQEAVKQNLNLFLAVFLDIGYVALHVFLIYELLNHKIVTLDTAYLGALGLVLIQIAVFTLFRIWCLKTLKRKLPKYSA